MWGHFYDTLKETPDDALTRGDRTLPLAHVRRGRGRIPAATEAIADLADTYEDAAVFDPHVTLRGGLTGDRTALAETIRELAETTEPLDIAFGDVQCSTTAHQCVFLLVTPTLELLRLRRQATAAFDRAEETYVPHLSLLYGELSLERRVASVEAIDTSALPERGRCTAITLVDTTGPVREWESIRSVRL